MGGKSRVFLLFCRTVFLLKSSKVHFCTKFQVNRKAWGTVTQANDSLVHCASACSNQLIRNLPWPGWDPCSGYYVTQTES